MTSIANNFPMQKLLFKTFLDVFFICKPIFLILRHILGLKES